MPRLLLGSAALLAAAMVATGCLGPKAARKPAQRTPTLPLSARPAESAELSAAEITRGAKLCLAKCVRCHALYDPRPYQDQEWRGWMRKMSRKARLNSEQEELLLRYLGGFRAVR